MVALFLLFGLWILYPLFGIPFSIYFKSENKNLKKKIEDLEFENRMLRYSNPCTENTQMFNPGESNSVSEKVHEESTVSVSDECITKSENNTSVAENSEGIAAETVSETEFSSEFENNSEISENTVIHNNDAVSDENVFSDQFISEKQEQKTRNVSGLLITGVSMVLLAGLIFVTTNWNSIGDGVKIFLIMLATVMFFGASVFSEKKLGLQSTGKGFFVLGTLFVPITCVSLFFFEIFGSWLSLTGEGMWLALMAVFLSCSLSCILITRKYNTKPSAFAAMMFISAAVCSLGLFFEWFVAFIVLAAAYSCALLVINEETLSKFGIPFVYVEVYKLFTRINVFMLAFIAVIYSAVDENAAEVAASMAFALAATVFVQVNTENKTSSVFCRIFSVIEYLSFSGCLVTAVRDYRPVSDSAAYLIMICLCIPAFAAYTFVPKIKSQLSLTILVSSLFIYSMVNFGDGHPAGAFIVAVMLIIASMVSTNKISSVICRTISVIEYLSFSYCLINAVGEYRALSDREEYLLLTCLFIPAFAAFMFVPKIKSLVSSSLLVSIMFICSMANFEDGHPVGTFIVTAMLVIFAVANKNTVLTVISSVLVLPLAFAALYQTGISEILADIIMSVSVSVLLAAGAAFSHGRRRLAAATAVAGIYASFIPLYTAMSEAENIISLLILAVAAAAFGVAAFFFRKQVRTAAKILSVIAASVYFQIFAFLLTDMHIFSNLSIEGDNFPSYFASFIVMAIVAAAGVAMKNKDDDSGNTLVYSSALITLISLAAYVPDSGGYWPFVFEVIYIAYCVVCGMVSYNRVSKVFYTAASVIFAYALACQNFFEVSEYIKPEYIIFCTLVPYIFLFRIWNENRTEVGNILYVHACVAMLGIVMYAISENELSHALSIGITCVVILIISSFTGSVKWRRFATITLTLLILYVTRDFWASLAWWVYLLTAGIILIAYAAFNEYCRKTGTENVLKTYVKSALESRKNEK